MHIYSWHSISMRSDGGGAIYWRNVCCRCCRRDVGAVIGEHLLDNAVRLLEARVEQPALAARLHSARLLGDGITDIEEEELHKARTRP